jgi:ABC-type sugar transport system substrate-binding protein
MPSGWKWFAFLCLAVAAAGSCARQPGARGQRQVFIVGYDATKEAREAILSGGPLKADVIQYPRKIGEITISTMARYLRGGKVPRLIPVEVGMVDRQALLREQQAQERKQAGQRSVERPIAGFPGFRERPKVGVTLLTRQHEFYQDLEAAMIEAAKQEGLDLEILSCDFKVQKQTDQVEDFITSRVSAIVVCPADSEAIAGAVKRANQAGVPVFTADITAHGGKVVSHIASDNVQGGRLAGEYMAKLLKGKGNIVIITHPVTTSVQDRVAGFKQAISKYPAIKILDEPTGEGQRAKAAQVMENMLEAHANLDAVFAINDDTALGAVSVLKRRQGIR